MPHDKQTRDPYDIIAALYIRYVDCRAQKEAMLDTLPRLPSEEIETVLTQIGANVFQFRQRTHNSYCDDMKAMFDTRTRDKETGSHSSNLSELSAFANISFTEMHYAEEDALDFEYACTAIEDKAQRQIGERVLGDVYTLYPALRSRPNPYLETPLTGYGTGMILGS